MANKEFAKYAADQTWETTGGDFENAPDGVYTGQFTGVEVKKSGSGYWMLVVKILIAAAEEEEGMPFISKTHYLNMNFEGKNGWNPWKVKQFFKAIGIELPEFKKVEPTLQELVDANTGFNFEIKTKNDFANVKILEVLEDYTADVDENAGGDDEDSTGSSDMPSPEEVDEMSKEDLVAFAEEHDITLASKIVSKMKAQIKTWIAENSSSGNDDEDAELKEKFVEFASSHGIDDIDDDTSIEDAKEVISELTFNEDELSDEEKEFLTENELGDCIKKEKKADKPAKPAPKKTGKK